MAVCYLSLGSNLGDRVGYIQQATSLLGETEGIKIVRTSAFYETEPVGMTGHLWFVNAIVEVKTSLTPPQFIEQCQRIESQLGRQRSDNANYEDRTIDIDVLFWNKDIIEEENITVPHKLMHKRAFTLVPLMELNPDYVHPIFQKTIVELHEELENPETVMLYVGE